MKELKLWRDDTMPKIRQSVLIDVEDIVDVIICDLLESEIIDLIKEIDIKCANWDLTLELVRYFREQEVMFLEEK